MLCYNKYGEIMSKLNEEFLFNVYSVVNEVPRGKVATYGQIAKMIGRDKNSRLVGSALKHSSMFGEYPCHRIVNHSGRLTPGWLKQKELLLSEGIVFKENGNVDLKLCGWK